ncbi:MAG TPA: CAP domain-containing protein, partial [Cellvibrio sp.]|nr:CAP domain-containing protein [Cellvibrio sp.]
LGINYSARLISVLYLKVGDSVIKLKRDEQEATTDFGVTASSVAQSTASSSNSSLVSSSSSTSSSASALAAPQNIAVVPANGSVTLTWNAVVGATSYNIYYASEAKILIRSIASFDDGTMLQNVSSPRFINSLRNNETYYFVVTAVSGNVESLASLEVSATPSAIDVSKQPTAQEVLVMELVNRARANPEAEAARYGISLNDGITGAAIAATPKQPLAHNLLLIDAACAHSQWMLGADIFSHTGINDSTPSTRMSAAGYLFAGSWMSGENIAWGGTTGSSINLTNYALQHHEGLFKSPGHRLNILEANFRELGIGQKQGFFLSNGTNYVSSMLTQNFARSGSSYYLTGVVYKDLNNNEFYDVGEGLSGINISFNGATYPVYAAGAYSIPVSNGTYNLTITGDALGSAAFSTVQINNANVKMDVLLTGNIIKVVLP